MTTTIAIYNAIKEKVTFIYEKLKLAKAEKTKGRTLLISIIDIITMGLFRSRENIASKKALSEILNLEDHYKTLVVNLNRFALLTAYIMMALLRHNRKNAHLLKHTDATDLPVCLVKNGKHHRTMRGLASWGKTGKGWFYGLKLHLTSDFKRNVLALRFTSGNKSDATVFLDLNKDLEGIFIADAGYTGEKLAREFYREHRRLLLARPRKNMKKLMNGIQSALYGTRMMVEWNFRSLKMTYGIVTSLPRSIDGYIAHYIYALTAFLMA